MDISPDLARRLTAAGRDWLGSGDAALVLACHPGWALKLGYDGDDAWPAWARWCQANPGPHLPVIGGVEVLVHEGRPLAFLGLVERLRPTLVGRRWIKAMPHLKRNPLGLASHVEAEYPALAATLRAAAAAFPRGHWDMGGANWLERNDGVVVMTDPLSRADVGVALAA